MSKTVGIWKGWILVNRVTKTGHGDVPILRTIGDTQRKVLEDHPPMISGDGKEYEIAVRCTITWEKHGSLRQSTRRQNERNQKRPIDTEFTGKG
jgi:hypothetical protein